MKQTNAELSKQAQKSARARELILSAANECLAELGYAATTINHVVERTGMSKGALQYHFRSKEELIACAAVVLLQKPLKFLERDRPGARHNVRDRLKATWTSLTNTKSYMALLEVLMASRTDKLLHKRISVELRRSVHDIDNSFAADYKNLNEADAQQLQRLMCANRCLMRGLLLEKQYGLSNREQNAVLEVWWDSLVPALEAFHS